jgi:hypothetical protein
MKNAHLRVGKMTFSKTLGKSRTSFSLHVDRFIGERVSNDSPRAHFLSAFGGDAQIAAAHAIISEQESFSIEGPCLEPLTANMGKDAQCYRASIALSTSKRSLRHLIAVSKEFGDQVNSDAKGRTLLADSSPQYLWSSIAQIFGLPALPEWAEWFYQKLHNNLAITQLYGLGCRPVLVTGTKEEFLRWLSVGIQKGEIQLPERNGPATWPSIPLQHILLAPADALAEDNPAIQ